MRTLYIRLKWTIRRLGLNRQGQTMLEYALLAGFVAVAIALVVSVPGDNVKAIYQDTASVLNSTESGSAPAATPAPAPSGDPDNNGNGKNKKPKKPKKPKKKK